MRQSFHISSIFITKKIMRLLLLAIIIIILINLHEIECEKVASMEGDVQDWDHKWEPDDVQKTVPMTKPISGKKEMASLLASIHYRLKQFGKMIANPQNDWTSLIDYFRDEVDNRQHIFKFLSEARHWHGENADNPLRIMYGGIYNARDAIWRVLNGRESTEKRGKLTAKAKEASALFEPKSPEMAIVCFAPVLGLAKPRDQESVEYKGMLHKAKDYLLNVRQLLVNGQARKEQVLCQTEAFQSVHFEPNEQQMSQCLMNTIFA